MKKTLLEITLFAKNVCHSEFSYIALKVLNHTTRMIRCACTKFLVHTCDNTLTRKNVSDSQNKIKRGDLMPVSVTEYMYSPFPARERIRGNFRGSVFFKLSRLFFFFFFKMNSAIVIAIVVLTLTVSSSLAAPHGAAAPGERMLTGEAGGRIGLNANTENVGREFDSERLSCMCPQVYMPVCCLREGTTFIASNSCHCTCSKGVVIGDEKCNLTGPFSILESIRNVFKANI